MTAILVSSSVLTESEIQTSPVPPDFDGLKAFLPWLGDTLQAIQELVLHVQTQLETSEESASEFREATAVRVAELQRELARDKEMLETVKDEYNSKLSSLRCEKELIKQKTEDFMTNLLSLQEQLQEKTDELTSLRSELDLAYQKIGDLQEHLQNE